MSDKILVKVAAGDTSVDKKITVTYPLALWSKAYGNKIKELSRTVKLPGFRAGKVPKRAIVQNFGSKILQEIMESEIPKALTAELEAKKIRPAHFDKLDMEKLAAEQDFDKDIVVSLALEVFPDIEVPNLDKAALELPKINITAKDMATTLENMQKMYIEWDEVERAAKAKDKVVVDFVGSVDGKEFEGGSAEAMDVVIGDKRLIPGFEDGLVGIKKGDSKDLKLKFPKDYGKAELADKPVTFKVKVKSVNQPRLPELNDEFAKKFDLKDLAILKKEVKDNLQLQASNKLSSVKKQLVADLVLSKVEFEVPETFVQAEIQQLKQQSFAQYGLPQQQMKALIENTPTTDKMHTDAARRVRVGLIFNQMIEDSKITPAPEQLLAKITQMAQGYENPAEAKSQLVNDRQAMQHAAQMVVEDELVNKIYKSADITEKELSFQKFMADY